MQTSLLDPATEIMLQADAPALVFYVAGRPATAGNKSAFPFKRHDGSLGVRVTEGRTGASRDHAKTWRSDLRAAAEQAIEGGEWSVPDPSQALRMNLVIARRRPSGHLGTGKNAGVIKDRFRSMRPTARPDSIKLTRAIEDALSTVAYHDDSAIVSHSIEKVFGDQIPGGSVYDEGVRVEVALV